MFLFHDDDNFKNLKQEKEIKVFVSLPMSGIDSDKVYERMKEIFVKFCVVIGRKDNSITLIDQFFKMSTDEKSIKNTSVWCLGDSIKMMSKASIVIFSEDYITARGCRMEKEICVAYNIPHTDEYSLDRHIDFKIGSVDESSHHVKTEYSPLLHTNVVVEEEK